MIVVAVAVVAHAAASSSSAAAAAAVGSRRGVRAGNSIVLLERYQRRNIVTVGVADFGTEPVAPCDSNVACCDIPRAWLAAFAG